MSEYCDKCKKEMKLDRNYNDDDFDIWEYICLKCDRKKIIQVCTQCEHEESWYEKL